MRCTFTTDSMGNDFYVHLCLEESYNCVSVFSNLPAEYNKIRINGDR